MTPLMSKIYLRLVSAPPGFWEREGVLYISAGDEGGRPVKASKVLYGLLGVASATAHKALGWMHEQGIVGYFAGKNGAGIRIFLNRASTSIGVRTPPAGKKILPFARGSSVEVRGSNVEPAFNDSFAVLEVLDSDNNPHAPKNGAEQREVVKIPPDPQPAARRRSSRDGETEQSEPPQAPLRVEVPVDEIVARLSREFESVARSAAAREHERTREWLESRGLPKAARVAQHETYNVLRKYGVIGGNGHGSGVKPEAGRGSHTPPEPRPLSGAEVDDLAQACVALLETQGQRVERTLSEMSAEAGGFLLPEDAAKVRARAEILLQASRGGQGV